MSTTRILSLQLNLPLHSGDIPGFRAAIAELVGLEHELFHGHNNDPEVLYQHNRAYPLIQYTTRRGRATIIGLGEGADALRQILLPRLPQELHFAGQTRPINGLNMQERSLELQMLDSPQTFGLYGWLALNAENYAEWKDNPGAAERFQLLSRALTGHLRAMAERFEIPDFKSTQANILRIDNQKKVQWHGTELVRFNVLAEANLSVPYGVGLGRASAFGFGELLAETNYERILQVQTQRNALT